MLQASVRTLNGGYVFEGGSTRSFIAGIVVGLLLVFGGAYLVIYLGLFPVGADNPPGTLECRLARTATGAYLAKYAPTQGNPFQPTSENLILGARECEEHCAVCHGGAASKISPLQNRFSPSAPQLVNRVPRDPDGEFWWITKYGFRMTGMPAWDGILSDDEMWKVVAFIKNSDKLPPDAQTAWQAAAGQVSKEGDEKR